MPQPNGKLVHAWDRAQVKAHAPRLEGKKVWKKLLKVLGAGDNEAKLQQAQAELSKDGAGSRKKRRTSGTKQLIRDAEWKGTEWEGFGDDIMKDVAQTSSENTNENDTTPVAKKRRANDKIVTPRKPLRQVTINEQGASSIGSGQQALDDAVAIAKRAKKAMRKSGLRMSMLVDENTEAAPQSEAQAARPILDSTQHAPSAGAAASVTISMSPSQISPRKRIAMRKSGLSAAAVLGAAKRASMGETRRLSGALFAEASPTTVVTTIDFGTTTATSIEFGKNCPAPVGTPVRTRIVPPMPKTAPAKIQPTRSEIEQEMANFFTPIPRLKKVKRRSSPIKSYLQQLLENQGTSFATNDKVEDDKPESITPEMQVDSPLGFKSIAAVASPKDTSSPCPVKHKVESAIIELTGLSADAKEVRLDPDLVPDLSISRTSAITDSESEGRSDAEDDDVSMVRDESICADEDPEDQLRAELAAQHSREPSPGPQETVQPVADAETPKIQDEDDLMLDVADEPSAEPANVSNRSPAYIHSSFTAEAVMATVATDPAASSSDTSDSNEPAVNPTTEAVTSYEDEETAMLLAFITKNQAKKLSRTSPKAKLAASPLSALGVISGNASPPPKKVAKSCSLSKKSKKTTSDVVSEIFSSDAPDAEAPSAAESTSVRRSTRASKLPTVKSGIPTPSFIPVRLGTDEVKAPVKKEKTLEQITKLNTGKNKAGCLQPMVVLKRLKDQETRSNKTKKGSSSPDVQVKEDEHPKTGKDGKPKKNLVWAATLTHVREFDEKDVVRPAVKEKKDIKYEKSKAKKGDEKPADGAKRVRVGTASERASKIALGMVANGTPAKPTTATKRKLREPSVGKDKDGEVKGKEEKKIEQPRLTRKDPEANGGEKKEEVEAAPAVEKKVRQPQLKSPTKIAAAKKASLAL